MTASSKQLESLEQREAGRERPILFSGPMVRAILEGRKTQTRRVVKPQPPAWVDCYVASMAPDHWLPQGEYIRDPEGFLGRGSASVRSNDMPVRCPYGQPGDRLWVRETWQYGEAFGLDAADPAVSIEYAADGATSKPIPVSDEAWHRATEAIERLEVEEVEEAKWRPSIHMPRWASRLSLEITEVRVQRLQEISVADIRAEGAIARERDPQQGGCPVSAFDGEAYTNPRDLWRVGWDSLNADRGYGWDANPWVWAISFRRIND